MMLNIDGKSQTRPEKKTKNKKLTNYTHTNYTHTKTIQEAFIVDSFHTNSIVTAFPLTFMKWICEYKMHSLLDKGLLEVV